MCGIFGAIKTGSTSITLAAIKAVASEQEARGMHAFGVAWIDSDNRLHQYKAEGRISQHLEIFDRMQNAKAIIGHTRYSTHGDPDHLINNHPHSCDGGWIVHNGVVSNHQDLNDQYDLLPTSECDSETLALLIQTLDGTLLERVAETVNLVETDAPLCIAGIWQRTNRVAIARRGNPLMMSEGKAGNLYFGSLGMSLPGEAKDVPADTAFLYDLTSGRTTEIELEPYKYGRTFAGSGTVMQTCTAEENDDREDGEDIASIFGDRLRFTDDDIWADYDDAGYDTIGSEHRSACCGGLVATTAEGSHVCDDCMRPVTEEGGAA